MDPPQQYPAFDGALDFTSSACKGTKQEYPKESFPVSFDLGRNFTFTQLIDRPENGGYGRRDVHVTGDVVFRRDGAESSTVTIEMISNDERITYSTEYNDIDQSLVLTTIGSIKWTDPTVKPCLSIRVTVWVPANGQLDALEINNIHLGVKLLDNLSIRVAKSVRFSTTVGDVSSGTSGRDNNQQLIHGAPPPFYVFNSRSIEVKTTSAHIHGCWPLYDLLYLSSISGNIAAGIIPQPANPDDELPASLFIKTASGNIEAWEPVHQAQDTFMAQMMGIEGAAALAKPETLVPPRHYEVNVHTISGTVTGALAFTKTGHIEGISGPLALDMLPVLPESMDSKDTSDKPMCDLSTSTTSGTTVLRLMKPLWVDASGSFVLAPGVPADATLLLGPAIPAEGLLLSAATPERERDEEWRRRQEAAGIASFLRVLRSRHSSTSATIRADYPGAWEGKIRLAAMSGHLMVSGKGVEVIKAGGQGMFNKEIVAHKGYGSEMTAETTSGDITLCFPQ
jgi:hypothetical protein